MMLISGSIDEQSDRERRVRAQLGTYKNVGLLWDGERRVNACFRIRDVCMDKDCLFWHPGSRRNKTPFQVLRDMYSVDSHRISSP
jgi:hypothetical protein